MLSWLIPHSEEKNKAVRLSILSLNSNGYYYLKGVEFSKMLQFPVNWQVKPAFSALVIDPRNRFKLILNDEWTLVLKFPQVLGSSSCIEIHRKNTDEEFSVSGELRFHGQKNEMSFPPRRTFPALLWEGFFLDVIKTGSSFIKIATNTNVGFSSDCLLQGHVIISDISKKQPISLANEESKERMNLKSLEELSKDFKRLLDPESSCFSDVTLKCDDVSILAHKIILSARSSVFAAMFANPMKESLKNEVDITDIDVSNLRALLVYMYTGKTSDLTVWSAADLLFAADKYQLQDLKTVCSFFLKETASRQNVLRILVLGDMLSEDLKSFAVDYICNKCGEFSVIENTEEWKALRKERPALAMDLLESLVKYRDEKLKR